MISPPPPLAPSVFLCFSRFAVPPLPCLRPPPPPPPLLFQLFPPPPPPPPPPPHSAFITPSLANSIKSASDGCPLFLYCSLLNRPPPHPPPPPPPPAIAPKKFLYFYPPCRHIFLYKQPNFPSCALFSLLCCLLHISGAASFLKILSFLRGFLCPGPFFKSRGMVVCSRLSFLFVLPPLPVVSPPPFCTFCSFPQTSWTVSSITFSQRSGTIFQFF